MTKAQHNCSAFGAAVSITTTIANLAHAPFTLMLVFEQLQTGWGYGTNIEMFALYPWLIELIFSPILLAGAIFLILSIFIRPKRSALIVGAIATGSLIAQYALLNLFIFF